MDHLPTQPEIDAERAGEMPDFFAVINQQDCPNGPHRGPEGPNEDMAQCTTCWSPSYAMRPEGETYGDHLPDCSLPRRHESFCRPGGSGHPTAPVIRGYWPELCDNPDPHRPHEHYRKPAARRRDCPGRRGDVDRIEAWYEGLPVHERATVTALEAGDREGWLDGGSAGPARETVK